MTKPCRICGQLLPLTSFGPNPNVADGLRSTCLACVEQQRQRTEKACDRCGTIKPLADYPKNGASFDGHRATCTACLRQERVQHRERERAERLHPYAVRGGDVKRQEGRLASVPTGWHMMPALVDGESWESTSWSEMFPDDPEDPSEWFWHYDEWGHPHTAPCIICGKESGIPCRVQTKSGWVLFGACGEEHARQHFPDVLRRAREAEGQATSGPTHFVATPTVVAAPPAPRTRGEAIRWARDLLNQNDLALLDVETTGKRPGVDEVIEIAVIDQTGHTLLHTNIKPQQPVPPDATRIHGITTDDLASARTFPEVLPDIQNALTGRLVVGYNVGFDVDDMLAPNALRHNLFWRPVPTADVLPAYGAFAGARYRISLESACRAQNVPIGGHRALGDCLATLGLLRAMAEADASAAPHRTGSTQPTRDTASALVRGATTKTVARGLSEEEVRARRQLSAIRKHCQTRNRMVAALLNSCALPAPVESATSSCLVIEARYQFHYEKLSEPDNYSVVEWAVKQELGASWQVRIILSERA